MTRSAAADLHNHVNRLHKYSDKLLLITCLKNTKTLTFPKCKVNTSLRTADVFPVVASLPGQPPPHLTLIIQLLFISFMRESNYLALPFAVSISPVQDNQSSLLLLGEDCTWTIKPCVGLQNEPRSKVWKT